MAGMSDLSATADLWGPVLDLGRTAAFYLGWALVVLIGLWLFAVKAFGVNFDVQKWVDHFKEARVVRRVLGSILAIVFGIAADMHFSPALFIAPAQAGPAVLVGSGAVVAGLACLFTKRHTKARRSLVSLSVVVTLIWCGGCAAGNAIGEGI